ncbi:MAG TPA: hypothetical protein DIU07_18155 [Rhodobacteraceae bacterium]|nr:hypothetical protein [Paracoccaceae bacterium]
MKSRVVQIAAMLAVLAAPAVAQIAVTPGVEGGATVRATPAFPGPAPAYDPEVEVAFWETVKDSGDPMLYLAYLEQFPEGAFRVIARNRLNDLWGRATRAFALLEQMGVSLDDVPGDRVPLIAAPPPAPGPVVGPVVVGPPIVVAPTPKPAPETASWQRVRNAQNQLRKHGCYKGAIDGVWGAGSKAAMRRFNRRAGTSYAVSAPKSKALKFMRDLTKSGVRICR